jgi:hypothetical protein
LAIWREGSAQEHPSDGQGRLGKIVEEYGRGGKNEQNILEASNIGRNKLEPWPWSRERCRILANRNRISI